MLDSVVTLEQDEEERQNGNQETATGEEKEEEEDDNDDNDDDDDALYLPLSPSVRPPPVTVSRAVQQLLQRHGLSACGSNTPSNGNVVTCTGFVRAPRVGSESDSDFDSDGRDRPEPIGTASSASTLADVNGNTETSNDADDAETQELAKLRCQSVRTEVLAEKYRRKNRCADYPGFAFGSSVFSSDTMMKFNIIKNELHNIMNNQLKRVSLQHFYLFQKKKERKRKKSSFIFSFLSLWNPPTVCLSDGSLQYQKVSSSYFFLLLHPKWYSYLYAVSLFS